MLSELCTGNENGSLPRGDDPFLRFVENLFLRLFNRYLAEIFEKLRKFECGFAGTGTGSLVVLLYLQCSVLCEYLVLGFDVFNQCFHNAIY